VLKDRSRCCDEKSDDP